MRAHHYCGALLAAVTLSMAASGAARAQGNDSATTAAAAVAPPPEAQTLAPGTSGLATPPANPLPKELRAAERQNRDGQREPALAAVDAYLEQHPDDSAGRFLRGVILIDMRRNEEAIRVFTMLTVDHPELEQPYNNLGVLYAQAGELELARRSLEQAVQADPQNAVALENLGDVYARLSLDTYQKALAVNTSNRGVRTKLTLARSLADRTPGLAPTSGAPAGGSSGTTPATRQPN